MDAARSPPTPTGAWPSSPDLDNDGIADVLMNGRNFLYVLRGTGDGHFAYMNKSWGVPDFAWATVDEGLCFGDVDGDGRLDLVACAGNEDHKRCGSSATTSRRALAPRPPRSAPPATAPAAGAKIRLYASPARGTLLACEHVVIAARQTAHSYYTCGATDATSASATATPRTWRSSSTRRARW